MLLDAITQMKWPDILHPVNSDKTFRQGHPNMAVFEFKFASPTTMSKQGDKTALACPPRIAYYVNEAKMLSKERQWWKISAPWTAPQKERNNASLIQLDDIYNSTSDVEAI